jgi:diguanylate cyclase
MPPHPFWFGLNQHPAAAVFNLGDAESGVLAVRVWKAPLFSFDDASAGGFLGLPVVGNPTNIADLRGKLDYQFLNGSQFRRAEALLYSLVVVFGLFFWIRNRRETLPLWMAGNGHRGSSNHADRSYPRLSVRDYRYRDRATGDCD